MYIYLKMNVLEDLALLRHERFPSKSRADLEISVVTPGILL